MNVCNVIMECRLSALNELMQNWQYDADGNRLRSDLTVEQAALFSDLQRGEYRSVAQKTCVDMFLDDIDAAYAILDAVWPNDFAIMAVYERSGWPLGIQWVNEDPEDSAWKKLCTDAQHAKADCDGQDAMHIYWWTGTQTYPVDASMNRYFPEEDATEAPKHLGGAAGWRERLWLPPGASGRGRN